MAYIRDCRKSHVGWEESPLKATSSFSRQHGEPFFGIIFLVVGRNDNRKFDLNRVARKREGGVDFGEKK